MSYQVLARKWRPRYFDEMAGQEHVLQALVNALDNDRLHHAYLFSGTRGVGKTTIARIFAKCLNCEQGVSSKPCGTCGSCMEIAEGRFIDLIEVDAASRTKVEDTRELLDNVQYAPTRGRFKVYLIDEVHMLTGHSFNALLKTLEEPPPHVKFLLATTEPQKLPVTILSRCLQFNLKNLASERIVEHLNMVLKAENIPFEDAALWALARAARGSMRDGLSLTDQAIAHGAGTVLESEVNAMLGTIDRSMVLDICRALVESDGVEVLRLVDKLAEHSPDYEAALADMIGVWHQVAVAQTVPEALDTQGGNAEELLALAEKLGRDDVQLFYQICLLGRRDLPFSGDLRSGFEMILLRQLAFEPVANGIAPLSGASGGGASGGQVANDHLSGTQNGTQTETKIVEEAPEPPKKSESPGHAAESSLDSLSDGLPPLESYMEPEQVGFETKQPLPIKNDSRSLVKAAPKLVKQRPKPDSPMSSVLPGNLNNRVISLEAGSRQSSKEPDVGQIELVDFSPKHWRKVYEGLDLGGMIENTAANLILLKREGNKLSFRLDADNDALYDSSHRERLEEAMSRYFGESITLEIEQAVIKPSADSITETPRAAKQREQYERQQEAIRAMQEDPLVNQLIERFDGVLLEDSISPLED